MKKTFAVRLSCLLSVILILAVYQVVTIRRADADQIAKLQYELEQSQSASTTAAVSGSGSYKDGTYTGEGQGFGGAIDVSVTVSGGKITDIEVTSHDGEGDAYFSMATDIIQNIIDAQSTDVDTISGATFSSTGIRTAVTEALKGAQ